MTDRADVVIVGGGPAAALVLVVALVVVALVVVAAVPTRGTEQPYPRRRGCGRLQSWHRSTRSWCSSVKRSPGEFLDTAITWAMGCATGAGSCQGPATHRHW